MKSCCYEHYDVYSYDVYDMHQYQWDIQKFQLICANSNFTYRDDIIVLKFQLCLLITSILVLTESSLSELNIIFASRIEQGNERWLKIITQKFVLINI